MIARTVLLQMAGNKKMEAFARHNPMAAGMAKRFIAGENLDQITAPVRLLNKQGLTVSLDYLGESVTTQTEVAEVVDTYLRLFEHIRQQKLDANVSIKLTSVGLDMDADFCCRNMQRLLQNAGPDQFVRIDMEGTSHTQRTLDLFYNLWGGTEPHKNTGVVIQSYLRRSEADIAKLIDSGVRVRLCKGAYKEPPDLAFQDKTEVDGNFIRLMQRLLLSGNYPGIATHDSRMIEATQAYAKENKIPTSRYEFQMLYGVRRDLQVELKRQGYNVRIYTPFGTHWYPYMMRRLAERPANLAFALRSMTGK